MPTLKAEQLRAISEELFVQAGANVDNAGASLCRAQGVSYDPSGGPRWWAQRIFSRRKR